MIGVLANPADHEIVREVFELFKTPWEFYRERENYEVFLCAGECRPAKDAKLVIIYSGRNADGAHRQRSEACVLVSGEKRLPIYGDSVRFAQDGGALLKDEASGECAAHLREAGATYTARIGYDLFSEVRYLLTKAQPVQHASIPTLELHLGFLRDLITRCGISLLEVPPVPADFKFIACLTHDVDHPAIRPHQWDHTTIGFLYRAVFGTMIDLLRGRLPFRKAMANWSAALKLPLIHLGLASDFWADFDLRYLEIENGCPSTFFLIPYENRPGRTIGATVPKFRASRYQAKGLKEQIRRLTAAGCEVGLHGLDAWLDSSAGREELQEIRSLTHAEEVGVRMHWLYFNESSFEVLERAGAAYDSTCGYNDTVGYRAGSTQVYKPVGVERLLELPMHAMDTALFYPSYLALSPKQATKLLEQLVDHAVEFGGCVTINWHDRSLSPERLWDDSYRELIAYLKKCGAWFATAEQAVSWFKKRRAVRFEKDPGCPGLIRASIPANHGLGVPGLRARIHKGQNIAEMGSRRSDEYADAPLVEATATPTRSGITR